MFPLRVDLLGRRQTASMRWDGDIETKGDLGKRQ
jgi:hypothetical protein